MPAARIVLFTVIFFQGYFLGAQPCNGNFLGSKTLYDRGSFEPVVPAGYEVMFINHAGRHGARHLTKDVNTSFAYKILAKADSLDQLTMTGKTLKAKVLRLEEIEKKDFKSISEEGRKEQQQIADDIVKFYPTLFKARNAGIEINFTSEKRTVQTADA